MTHSTDSSSDGLAHAGVRSSPDKSGAWRLKKIEFAFDERNLHPLEPLGKPYGQVLIKFTDSTAISEGCRRGDLEATIVKLINRKLDAEEVRNGTD